MAGSRVGSELHSVANGLAHMYGTRVRTILAVKLDSYVMYGVDPVMQMAKLLLLWFGLGLGCQCLS